MLFHSHESFTPIPWARCNLLYCLFYTLWRHNCDAWATEMPRHIGSRIAWFEIFFEAEANPPLSFSKQGTNHVVPWMLSTFYVQHLSEVAAVGWKIYWTFHSPRCLWGLLGGDPEGLWLAALHCLQSYGHWQLCTWQADQTSCHPALGPSQEDGSCWGLISAWRPVLLTDFNSRRAPFIMHCLSWAFNQMFHGIFTSRPNCPGPLYTITWIHAYFIHGFVCLLCYVVLALCLSVIDGRVPSRIHHVVQFLHDGDSMDQDYAKMTLKILLFYKKFSYYAQ